MNYLKNLYQVQIRGKSYSTSGRKFQEGLKLHQLGDLARAKSFYISVLSIDPKHFDALHLLGLIEHQSQNYHLAIDLISQALKVFEKSELAHCNLGNVFLSIANYTKALEHYDRSISICFEHFEAHFNKGIALKALGRFEEAIVTYQIAIALKPDFEKFQLNTGALLNDLGQSQLAKNYFDNALIINPVFAEAFCNRGVALNNLGQTESALHNYEIAISIKPNYQECHSNKGVVLQDLKKTNQAIRSLNNAIQIDFIDAESHFNLGLSLLRSGDMENGLIEYEWRWMSPSSSCFKTKREFSKPLWLGQYSLTDKTILIHAEQGLGDSIQFVRYLELVTELGAKVIFEVQAPLVELFKQMKGNIELVVKGNNLPDFDFHCPLMSLPLAFNTCLQTIPFKESYINSDFLKRQFWSQRLLKSNNPKVGLVWSGNVAHSNDRQRSLELSKLCSYLPDGFDYVSLQKEVRESDYEYLCNSNIQHFEEEIEDFTDTAALCSLMDLVICVDTSVAHLSAALGRPTWILLPFVPDWRWLLDREDSPWYPTVKLIRQQSKGEWAGALRSMQESLCYF